MATKSDIDKLILELSCNVANILHMYSGDIAIVVRCRDCSRRLDNTCPMEHEYPWYRFSPDDFCSFGKRDP